MQDPGDLDPVLFLIKPMIFSGISSCTGTDAQPPAVYDISMQAII
jgi:hypothetical protein